MDLKHYPRWLLADHDLGSLFNSQLATGKAAEVTARIRREPAALSALLGLLANPDTPMGALIGIGVVMEDLAGSALLQQQVPVLGKLSQHADARIRADACHYLGLSGSAEAVPYLQAALQDGAEEVREVAADALGAG